MRLSEPFSSTPGTQSRLRHTRQSEIPSVTKSGSSSSPAILSPGIERELYIPRTNGNNDICDALPDVVPSTSAFMSANLPLFSPSEGSLLPPISDDIIMETASSFADANPVDHCLPTPPCAEPSCLRLPSFNTLGIAAPHPNDIGRGGPRFPLESMGGFPLPWMDGSSDGYNSSSPDFLKSPNPNFNSLSTQQRSPRPSLSRSLDLITPPEDASDFHWTLPLVQSSGVGNIPDISTQLVDGESTQTAHAGDTGTAAATSSAMVEEKEEEETDDILWIRTAMNPIVLSVNIRTLIGRSLRVLSHALPSPSIPGHAFPKIIDKLRLHSPNNPLTWINLLHAVPGRFNLADLPTTPPSTPGLPLGGGDDYFTTKIFESAVSAMDFEEGVAPTHARQHPLAAPASINLCVVERYIPPCSANEFANLFNIRAPSLIVDRLTELAPGNGCLVFIYPTKTGGETFLREYLGPVLDPLLRSMVVVNNFSADLSITLGRMMSVERLPDFDTIRQRASLLCNELNQGGMLARQRLHGVKGGFSLTYAEKHEAVLDGDVWTDWWIKQEKARIRTQVIKYFANRLPSEGEWSPSNIIQQVLDGVAARAHAPATASKVEVGVYVIQRSS